jgi:hypothetical protein
MAVPPLPLSSRRFAVLGFLLTVLVVELAVLSERRQRQRETPRSSHTPVYDTPVYDTPAHDDAPRGRRLLEQAAAPVERPPTTILGVGLPRTGAETLHHFFTCHGLASVHYCCDDDDDDPAHRSKHNPSRTAFPCRQRTCGACLAATRSRPAWQGCGPATTRVYTGIDVETPDSWFLPQQSALALLLPVGPPHGNQNSSLWILTQRANATVWAESVLHWHSATERLLRAFGHATDDSSHRATLGLPTAVTAAQVATSLAQGLARASSRKRWQQRRTWLAQAYRKHLSRVRRTAAAYDQPLVEVVVDDPAAGRQLAEAMLQHGVFSSSSSSTDACWDWQAARVDDDWRDFSVPF